MSEQRSEPASSEAAPEIIAGLFRVEAAIGRGGMGTVYRVRDLRDGREVALKRLQVRSRRKNQALELFEREFHTLAELRHPRIIEAYDYGVEAQASYYTMELLAGTDLRELAPLAWPLACKYLREVAESLALLHARRLVHRDVTPKNVRVGVDGHCKLFDFGALAEFGAKADVVGTPPCIPPEALEGRPIDQRIDLYALGCLGYYLLTGGHAYPATDSRQLRTFWARSPEPPSRACKSARTLEAAAKRGATLPEVPPALDTLIMSLLALDPLARPASASAVIDRLDLLVGGSPREEQRLSESYLASAPLCGRKRELGRVKLALDRVLRGRGTNLTFIGEPGAGRTRLLSAVGLRATLRGCTVVEVDAAEHVGPYATVIALALRMLRLVPPALSESARRQVQESAAALEALLRQSPELARAFGRASLDVAPPAGDEPTRDRALCSSALLALFVEVARLQPLAILVDDVHRADEASLGVLGALALEARKLKILVAATRCAGDEALAESGLTALVQRGAVIELPLLDEPKLREWLSAIFGDALNLGRLSSFLYERTRGRPSAVASLVRFLIARGELKLRDGTWALPSDPRDMALPDDIEVAALDRLLAGPERARALAEALSMHRGPITLELCTALAASTSEAALVEDLAGLVRMEVLTTGGSGYRFTSERLREKVAASIDPARRAGLHLRMGEAILARARGAPLDLLAAGVHLLEAQDPRGLPLSTAAASYFADRIDGIGSAVRLLERAFLLAREAGAPAAHQLALLSPLGLGAYAIDHRLARYEGEISERIEEVAGLTLARRLGAWGGRLGHFGARLGTLIGLGLGVVRYYALPKRERVGNYRLVLRQGVAALVALCGRATVCLDTDACYRIVDRLAPLRALGMRDPGGFAVEYARTLAMATEDRYGETRKRWLELEDALRRKVALAEVPIEQRRLWTGGVAYGLGVFESFQGNPAALERAAELEASGSDMHAMIAAQLRLQYHGFRGEAEQVRKCYERLEAYAIQTGSSWQVDTWAAIAVNLFAAVWHDVILAKRAMRDTQRMQETMPSIARYAIASEATYLLRRGQPRECADLYEPLLDAEQPLSRIGWSTSCGLLAEAYNQLGMHGEAKALCERVFEHTRGEDRIYFAMRMSVDLAYAMALAGLGEADRAVRHLTELREQYAEHASPAALGSVHEALARIELARGNRKRFTENLKEVEGYFTKLGNPALIARFQALSDLAGEGGGMVSKVAVMREVRAFDVALDAVTDRTAGARAILAWLMKSCEGYEGYLFTPPHDEDAEEPELIAATGDGEPPIEVFEKVSGALRSLGKNEDTTQCGTGAATHRGGDGGASHLFLLSYFEADDLSAEGALVLVGRAPYPPPIRYELLQAAALQLSRLRSSAS